MSGKEAIRAILDTIGGNYDLDKLLETLGYSYDSSQNIFYSNMDAWQRNFGYCRLYDEALPLLNMIVDCEPIYFNYSGKRWMIELWKGQYALTTGCEVGVYNTDRPDIDIPGVFKGTFYHAASDEERLNIEYVLKKNGKNLFRRKGLHWWLTGFILGMFSEPYELTMEIKITLRDLTMRKAFVRGLINAGYAETESVQIHNTVSINFDQSRNPQPYTRTPLMESLVQKNNKMLCELFQKFTGMQVGTTENHTLVKREVQELYGSILTLGKNREVYEKYADLASEL